MKWLIRSGKTELTVTAERAELLDDGRTAFFNGKGIAADPAVLVAVAPRRAIIVTEAEE